MKKLILIILTLAFSITALASKRCPDETSLIDDSVQEVIISQDKVDFNSLLNYDLREETLKLLNTKDLKNAVSAFYYIDGDLYLSYGRLDSWFKTSLNKYVEVQYSFNSLNKDNMIQEYRCTFKVRGKDVQWSNTVFLMPLNKECPLRLISFKRARVDYRDNKDLSFSSLSHNLGESFEVQPICND